MMRVRGRVAEAAHNDRAAPMAGEGAYCCTGDTARQQPMSRGIPAHLRTCCALRPQSAAGRARPSVHLGDTRAAAFFHIDFAAHAASMGPVTDTLSLIAEPEPAVARCNTRSGPVAIDADRATGTNASSAWWRIAVPHVSERPNLSAARTVHVTALATQRPN